MERVELSQRSIGEGIVATLTVDRRNKLNTLNHAMVKSFRQAIRAAADVDELRAVVVEGAGEKAFVGGADVASMQPLQPATARDFITGLHKVCEELRALPVPVIASIRGYCLGAGMEIAAACDMRAATTSAVFGMPEVRVGVPSVIEAALLPGLIGWGKTRELLLTGDTISATEAHRIGFAQRLCEPDELDHAVQRWLDSILASAPRAVSEQKRLIARWEETSLAEGIQAGIHTFADAYTTPEPSERMSAFLSRPRT